MLSHCVVWLGGSVHMAPFAISCGGESGQPDLGGGEADVFPSFCSWMAVLLQGD